MVTKAVFYARVSTKEQEREGYSIPAQVELFKDYAKKNKLKIDKEYLESESAKNADRKLFKEMLSYVRKNNIDVIIFEKVDRMTRNFKDLIEIYNLIETTDTQVHIIKNGLKLDKNSKSQDKFNLDIQVVLAKNYINNLSEEIKKGMDQKRKSGEWGHIAPFGYKNTVINGKKTIIPDEHFPLVKKMFELALEGYSIGKIATEISKTKEMRKSNVNYCLKNPFYMGYGRSKGELYRHIYETAVSPKEFEKVQRLSGKRNNKKDATKRVFKFSGYIYCDCGSKMYGEYKKAKGITTYGCKSKKCTNSVKYLSENKIIKQLQPFIETLSFTEEDKKQIQLLLKEMFNNIESEAKVSSEKNNKAIQRIKTKITKLFDYLDDDLINKEEFVERKASLQDKLNMETSRYSANVSVSIKTREDFTNLFELAVNLDKYWYKIENASLFQELMKNYVSNLIMKDGKLAIAWTELGKLLFSRYEGPKWWTG